MKKILTFISLSFSLFALSATAQSRSLKYDSTDFNKYSDNMTMTCVVRLDGTPLLDCEVAAFDAEGELRGAMLSDADDEGRMYLAVQGDTADEPIAFRVVYATDTDVPCFVTTVFRKGAIAGTYNDPFVIDVSAEVSITDVTHLVDALCSGTASRAVHDINTDGILDTTDVTALADMVLQR